MAKFATGKRSQAISDRSGADAIALQNSRNMKFQQPIQPFVNTNTSDVTITNSGGASVGVANLTLPGDFAFKTQDFKITRTINGVQETSVIHSMVPEDPSLQNRRRELTGLVGQVEVSIT